MLRAALRGATVKPVASAQLAALVCACMLLMHAGVGGHRQRDHRIHTASHAAAGELDFICAAAAGSARPACVARGAV